MAIWTHTQDAGHIGKSSNHYYYYLGDKFTSLPCVNICLPESEYGKNPAQPPPLVSQPLESLERNLPMQT